MARQRGGVIAGLMILGLAAGGPVVCAQDVGKGSGSKGGDDVFVLAGPRVKEIRVPGQEDTLTGRGVNRRGMGQTLQPNVLFKAISILEKEPAPEGEQLSDSQRESLRELMKAYRAKVRENLQAHSEDIELYRKIMKMSDEDIAQLTKGDKPGMMEAMEGDVGRGRIQKMLRELPGGADPRDYARARLRALREGGPRLMDWNTRVWAVLNEPQQALVKAELARLDQQRQKEKALAQQRNMLRRNPGMEGVEGVEEMSLEQSDEALIALLPERVQKRLGEMSEARRTQTLRSIRQRFERERQERVAELRYGDEEDVPVVDDRVRVPKPEKDFD